MTCKSNRWTYVMMLVIIFGISSSWGLKERNLNLRVKNLSFYPFLSFVFDGTGSMQMNVSVLPDRTGSLKQDFNALSFSLCTESQYRKLINNVETDVSQICHQDYSTRCELDMIRINDTRLQNYHVVQANLYVFMVANCQENVRIFSLSYTLLNNNGKSQLSVGDGPLPDVYTSLIFIWTIFLLALFFEVFIRSRTYKIELHYILALVLVLKIMVVGSSLIYWRVCAKTGYCYDSLLYLQSFLFAISESVFFSLLLLVAKGYKITRPTLPREEMRDVSVALVLLLSTLLFFSFYNPGYYLLSMMIMYFFMLPKIFTSITQNVYALRAQILMLEELQRAQQNREQNVASFRKKLRLFLGLKTVVVVYLVAILFVSFVRMMVGIYSLDWLNSFINEIVSLFVVISIFWMIRPQANLFSTDVDIFEQGWENNLDQLFMGMLDGDQREHIPEFHKPLDLSNTIVVQYPSNSEKTVASLAYKEGTPDPFKSQQN